MTKFRAFIAIVLGITLSEDEVLQWCDKLSSIVLDEVVASALLPDVADILAMLVRRNIQAHIVSGTPHDELQIIIERKGPESIFQNCPRLTGKKGCDCARYYARERIDCRSMPFCR